MGLNLDYDNGQTPLTDDEKEGLRISTVTTRGELDEFEQLNIEKAVAWTMTRKFKRDVVLSEPFIRRLHKQMFGDVWRWAGEIRRSDKNIGVNKEQIGLRLRQLLDDAKYWIANRTYPPDEFAIRLKHGIVSIHCFANGNGRHSRLYADVVATHVFNGKVFSWGAGTPRNTDDLRKEYLTALRRADNGDMQPLILFARS